MGAQLKDILIDRSSKIYNAFIVHYWLRQGAQGVSLSVCLSGTSLSKALNLHLSLISLSQVSLTHALNKTKYFRLRLSDEEGTERPKRERLT